MASTSGSPGSIIGSICSTQQPGLGTAVCVPGRGSGAPQEQSQGTRPARGSPGGLRTADFASRPDTSPLKRKGKAASAKSADAEQIQRPLLTSPHACPTPGSLLARNPGRRKALLLLLAHFTDKEKEPELLLPEPGDG